MSLQWVSMLTLSEILEAVPPGGLFPRGRELPWRASPEPLSLHHNIVRRLEGLGHVLAKFQDASHALYRRSAAGKAVPWLARLLDAGKPEWLVQAQRSDALRQAAPRVIRPDLLLGQNELHLVELDSVPGGMGITLWLSQVYARAGYAVLGGAEGMLEGLRRAYPAGVRVAVSEESAAYRAEMRWLVQQLGAEFSYVEAERLSAQEQAPIYRFWELFDSENIAAARALCEASASAELELSPPPLAHLEEKLWLALLHMPGLQSQWQKELRAAHLQLLRRIVPHSWVVDPAPLPPQAALPWLNVHSWAEVAAMGRAERRLVLKISGFSPLAWGSRGVVIGHDVNPEQWQNALQHALAVYDENPWLLQEFCEARMVEHPYYEADGSVSLMRGRVRLCPYYLRSAEGVQLAGCLATITPADKKKIHGMGDAILVPCVCK